MSDSLNQQAQAERPCCRATAEKGPRRRPFSAWLRAATSLPGAILPLLPSANCPLCLAAYAGVLSTLGLGFLFTERVLANLVPVFLAVGVASLAWSRRAHGRLWPLALAVVASVLIVCGRLIWTVPVLVYAGAPLFLAAALWNLTLRLRLMRLERLA